MYALYNQKTKEYAHIEAEIGYEAHCSDPTLQYRFVDIGGTMYTSSTLPVLEHILRIRDGQNGSNRVNYGLLHTPGNIKSLAGFKIVNIGHLQTTYRISTEENTGYEIIYRDFDGNVDQCMEHLDGHVRTLDRNGLLKGIVLKLNGTVLHESLYDVAKFVLEKQLSGE